MTTIHRLAALVLFYLILQTAFARRTRKTKPKETEETTPQPNVVTYSTFGFNDVGQTYDGFVPSSPDYASFLSGYGSAPESSTRLYAPAFPTAVDSSYSGYGQQQSETQASSGGDNSEPTSAVHYQQSFNFVHPFDARNSDSSFQSSANENTEDFRSPVYGAKISSKGRVRPFGQFNSSGVYGGETFNVQDQTFTVQEAQAAQETKPNGESTNSYYNMFNYAPTYPSINVEDTSKTTTPVPVAHSSIRFQKVFDFTKYKPNYPTEVDSKYLAGTLKSMQTYNSMPNTENYPNAYNKEQESPAPTGQEDTERYKTQPIGTNIMDFSINHITENSNTKNSFKNSKLYSEYKDQFKNRAPYNFSSDFSSNWKSPYKSSIYGNSSSYRYDYTNKRPYKTESDDNVISSSNIQSINYRYPDSDSFSSYKKNKPHSMDNYPSSYKQHKYQEDDDFYSQIKNYHTTSPPSTSSHWGSFYNNKNIDYSTHQKTKHKRPYHSDDGSDEIVHIPKRHKYHISKQHKHSKKPNWHKESTRFKSEEDLLGLRNHDTSHPSYIPDFKFSNDDDDDFQKYASENSYKNLMEKWRQAYLKSKYTKEYKDSTIYKDHDRDQYESYASESRPMLSPVPKPYPIEVPHPVIVPVPQPYPVQVPVPKPVAVPVLRELTVPIEKPVPYPVYKNVPFPVEKLVPVPVEKEVQVPVMKPYPVPVPHVRPVFHHSRHHSHEDLDDPDSEEEPYGHYSHDRERPEPHGSGSKKVVRYSKKIRSSRIRPRRPSLTFYDRNRRRWPSRSSPSSLRREVLLNRARRIKPFTSVHVEHSPFPKEFDDDDDY